MKRRLFDALAGGILGLALGLGWSLPTLAQGDPLPSWNATPTKQAIVEFVGRVTKPGSPDFVAPAERIAITRMPSANMPMTASRTSVDSTLRWMLPRQIDGR
jgi:hypothetical protein